jgi:hypothetical protein
MACLKAAGQLQHFPTFPLPYDRRRFRQLTYKDAVLMQAAGNLLEVTRYLGDAEVASDVAHTLRHSHWRRWIKDVKCRLTGRGRALRGSQ